MNKRARTFSRIEVEASEWLVTLSDRTVSLDQRTRFEAWLNADPEHERVYEVQKTAWSAVARMSHLSESTQPQLVAAKTPTGQRRRFFPERLGARHIALAATLALLAVGILFRSQIPLLQTTNGYETAVAQVKDFKLSDGTLVTLGAASRIDVDLRGNARRVVLTRGEAFFEVARDTSRPFFVTANHTLVRVLGTQFDVHYGAEAIRVAVLEGRVEVLKADEAASSEAHDAAIKQLLTPGKEVIATRTGEISAIDAVKIADLGAWRSGRLVYVDARLRDVVADINRYYRGKIELAAESTGDMQLTAAFRVEQIDRMLEVLQNALPLQARRTSDGHIVLSEQQSPP